MSAHWERLIEIDSRIIPCAARRRRDYSNGENKQAKIEKETEKKANEFVCVASDLKIEPVEWASSQFSFAEVIKSHLKEKDVFAERW